MFKRKDDLSGIVINQGERLVILGKENYSLKVKIDRLNRKCLKLQGKVDDVTDERIQDLKTIIGHLTRNDYGNPNAKIGIAIEFIENKIKELDNAANID